MIRCVHVIAYLNLIYVWYKRVYNITIDSNKCISVNCGCIGACFIAQAQLHGCTLIKWHHIYDLISENSMA